MRMDNGLRGEWKVSFTAQYLAEGAKAQKAFRLSRIAFWEGVKEDVLKQISSSGITVVQSASHGRDKLSYGSTQTMGPRVQVDRALEEQLQEAHGKIEDHRKSAAEYDGWIQFLEANASQEMDVSLDDWLFFFRKS